MGRLFWKFFFCFWLAQVLMAIGVGLAVWLNHSPQEQERLVDHSPPASMLVAAAASTLEHGGIAALRDWLKNSPDGRQPRRAPFQLRVIDAQGQDLLGREVNAAARADAEARLQAGGDSVQRRQAADGQSYLIFAQSQHGLHAEDVLRPLAGDLPSLTRRPPADGRPGDRHADRPAAPPGPPEGQHGHRFFDPRQLPPTLPLLGGALASLLSAWLLAWYFAKPIRSLRSAFGAAAEGNLSLRVGPGLACRKDELAALGEDFDHMAGRLQTLVDSQRRLLHDVSHELRSPLARLQAAIGLLRQQPERTPEFVDRIERESQRMDKLVGELLTLARLDAGMAGQLTEEIDLDEVLADLLGDASFEAETKGCAVSYDEPPSCPAPLLLRGNAELLHRALDNILRNAIRHSPANTEIQMSGHCAHGQLTLTIADRGPGVPEADLDRMFDPFVRSEASQTGNGYGLGLAIARRVVSAHGGRISAHNRDGGGLEMRIELPLTGH